MSWARNERERRWWRVALGFLGLIYLSLWPLQFALDFLRDRNLLRLSIGALGVAVATPVLVAVARRGARAREWLALAAVAAVYLLVAARLPIVQERLHLAEYGALALLFRAALVARGRGAGDGDPGSGAAASWLALALASSAGLVDELIQGVLPNRQYDLRDVGLNALAAGLALGSAAVLGRARAADLRARREGEWNRASS